MFACAVFRGEEYVTGLQGVYIWDTWPHICLWLYRDIQG